MNRPERLKWIAESQHLARDERLGEDQQRFESLRFTPCGQAIDSGGQACDRLACANCHLPIPRQALRFRPFFVSVAGIPSSGKTFFQTAMIHQLRKVLGSRACLEFQELDSGEPQSHFLKNEQMLFGDPDSAEPVSIAKTQEFGELYRLVRFGHELVSFPRPFLFLLQPTERHPNRGTKAQISRIMSFYDNAGESFEAGRDSLINPVTRHLGQSNVLMFCLDLSQEQAFQSRSMGQGRIKTSSGKQLKCFLEMTQRVRQHSSSKHKNLVMVVTKYDQWARKLGIRLKKDLWQSKERFSSSALDAGFVESVSATLREKLRSKLPELIDAAEQFSRRVIFVPVSATGCKPQVTDSGQTVVCPNQLKPFWTEVPLVYSLAKWCGGLIPYVKAARS